jgi:MFS family permease
MLATPEFYVMITMLTCGAFAALMFIPMISPIAQNMIGISPTAATAAVSTLALFNVFGRVFAGSISDRIGRINTLAAACVFSVVGLVLLFMAKEGDIALFYVGISIIGICFGAFMGVFPGFTADQFGPRYNSVNYGIMFIGFALAGYAGPSILNHIYGGSGSYNKAFLIAMVFSAAGLLFTFLYRMLKKRQ